MTGDDWPHFTHHPPLFLTGRWELFAHAAKNVQVAGKGGTDETRVKRQRLGRCQALWRARQGAPSNNRQKILHPALFIRQSFQHLLGRLCSVCKQFQGYVLEDNHFGGHKRGELQKKHCPQPRWLQQGGGNKKWLQGY